MTVSGDCILQMGLFCGGEVDDVGAVVAEGVVGAFLAAVYNEAEAAVGGR